MTPFDDATRDQLLDRAWVENAICAMGLAREPGIYPEHLHPFMGGARIWQYPCQLAPYLIWLSDKGIRSYCEIGVAYGGTLAATVGYLNRFTPIERVLVIDDGSMGLRDAAQLVTESLPHPGMTGVIWERSDSPRAQTYIDLWTPDLVLIDADHTEEACRADYERVRGAPFVAFHDICDWSVPGVAMVWAGVEGDKVEFTEQYGHAYGRTFFGIGVVS
jgi:hypothetical protein